MRYADILDQLDIFAQLSEEDRHSIAGLMKEQNVCSDTIIFRQGDAGNALYYVLSGQLNGTVLDADGTEKLVASFCQGHHFGEMGLLIGERCPFTVQAVTDTRLLVLEKTDLDAFLGQNIPAMLQMMKVIAQRKAERKQQPLTHGEQAASSPTPKPQPPAVPQTPVHPPAPPVSEHPPLPDQVSAACVDSRSADQGDIDRCQDALSALPDSRPSASYDDHLDLALGSHATGGKVITIFSPKGGVGKSTFAVNLAVAMARSQRG